MKIYTAFVGLDVHKDSIDVSLARGSTPPEHLGTVPHQVDAVLKLLERRGCVPRLSLLCYEAGPTGFGLRRQLAELEVDCHIVAPSLIPSLAGDRVKTDRRDSLKLARYLRSGDLVAIHVPDEHTEAIRDLERARGDAKKAERVARQNLSAFLLRHGRRYPGATNWTAKHLDWMRREQFEHETSKRVVEDYLHAVDKATERVGDLTEEIAKAVRGWRLEPLVRALQAFRGIRLITAVTVAAELGDLRRFRKASQLMSYVGLVPSEHSSGGSRRRGRITKTGNSHVRRVLVEAAWAYRFRPNRSRAIREREAGVSREVREIAWRAQKRLCGKYLRLQSKGKNKQQTVTAVARELIGFIWAAAHEDKLLAT